MAICERYTSNNEDATTILNEGFLKIFKRIAQYKPVQFDVIGSFRNWLRQNFVHIAIDYFRQNYQNEVIEADRLLHQLPLKHQDASEEYTTAQIIEAVRRLSPIYRIVFNLSVIEGMAHDVIAEKLKMSITACKSNLSNARHELQNILSEEVEVKITNNRSATR